MPLAFSATVMSLHRAVGGVCSKTHTVKVVVHVIKFPLASVTVTVIVVVPVPTSVPGNGFCVMVNKFVGVQLSVASTSLVTFGTTP